MSDTKTLVVEDEMITAADISMQLGYGVTGSAPCSEDALKSIEATRPKKDPTSKNDRSTDRSDHSF